MISKTLLIILLGNNFNWCQAQSEEEERFVVLLEGHSAPDAALLRPDGTACTPDPALPPAAPLPYGSPGRIGSSAAYSPESGHVVLCGGLDSSGPPISSYKDCQVLDLDKREWMEPSPVPPMPELLAYSGYAQTGDGQFIVAGGIRASYKNGPGPTNWLESDRIYSLDLNNYTSGWRELETRLPKNASHLCAAATGSSVFVLGADLSGKVDVAVAAADSKWKELPALNSADAGCIADADEFGSTHLYAVGGSAGTGNQIARMELGGDEDTWAEGDRGGWQTGGGLETKEQRPNRPAVARLPNSLVIAAGSPGADSVEMLAETGWTVREGALRTPRQDSASVTVDVKHFPECQ